MTANRANFTYTLILNLAVKSECMGTAVLTSSQLAGVHAQGHGQRGPEQLINVLNNNLKLFN